MDQQPIVAFLYDFDKTLCTTDMQNYAFIPSLGMTPGEFWAEANGFGRACRMDGILAPGPSVYPGRRGGKGPEHRALSRGGHLVPAHQ